MTSLVIIPTFNEKENIENIIRAVFELNEVFHVLVVDDGSPDGTAAIVKKLQSEFNGKLHVLEREGKQGLGTAYICGFKWGLKGDYEFIFEMDADFSHAPEDLPRLLKACHEDGFGMAVGSRYCKGGHIANWPFTRWLMSYLASVYVRMILWIGIKDTTAGFACYQRKVLEKIDLDNIWFIGYAFQIEMKYSTLKSGFKIKEVPVTFTDRVLGQSKMDMSIFKEAFLGVLKLRRKKF